MPSQIAALRESGGAGSSNAVVMRKRSLDGEEEEGLPVRREAWAGLYSKDDLTDGMKGKLKDVHAPFKRPAQDASKVQLWDPERATKKLGMVKVGVGQRRLPPSLPVPVPSLAQTSTVEEEQYTFEPLVLWRPPDDDELTKAVEMGSLEVNAEADGEEAEQGSSEQKESKKVRVPPIEVDGILARFLRPHQREGTQFLFDCTMGLRFAFRRSNMPSVHLLLSCPLPSWRYHDLCRRAMFLQ